MRWTVLWPTPGLRQRARSRHLPSWPRRHARCTSMRSSTQQRRGRSSALRKRRRWRQRTREQPQGLPRGPQRRRRTHSRRRLRAMLGLQWRRTWSCSCRRWPPSSCSRLAGRMRRRGWKTCGSAPSSSPGALWLDCCCGRLSEHASPLRVGLAPTRGCGNSRSGVPLHFCLSPRFCDLKTPPLLVARCGRCAPCWLHAVPAVPAVQGGVRAACRVIAPPV